MKVNLTPRATKKVGDPFKAFPSTQIIFQAKRNLILFSSPQEREEAYRLQAKFIELGLKCQVQMEV